MIDLSVNIAGVILKNPVTVASGTFGFGCEYNEYYDISRLGAVSVKGLTLKERLGNPPPRIAETPMGILNSVGLQNPGVQEYLKKGLPCLKKFGATVIANISGSTIEDYIEMARLVSDSETDLIEMNISCPNVKEGGVAFGTNAKTVEKITKSVKAVCKKPLIVKLSPNVTDITEMARAAESAGADALSLINTILGMKIDINTRRPVLHMNVGGLSGPAIMPVAVRMVWQVKNAVNLPVIGMGGITSGEDAIEFMLAGADAISVGTACFTDPYAPINVLNGIENYMKKHGYKKINELTGNLINY